MCLFQGFKHIISVQVSHQNTGPLKWHCSNFSDDKVHTQVCKSTGSPTQRCQIINDNIRMVRTRTTRVVVEASDCASSLTHVIDLYRFLISSNPTLLWLYSWILQGWSPLIQHKHWSFLTFWKSAVKFQLAANLAHAETQTTPQNILLVSKNLNKSQNVIQEYRNKWIVNAIHGPNCVWTWWDDDFSKPLREATVFFYLTSIEQRACSHSPVVPWMYNKQALPSSHVPIKFARGGSLCEDVWQLGAHPRYLHMCLYAWKLEQVEKHFRHHDGTPQKWRYWCFDQQTAGFL